MANYTSFQVGDKVRIRSWNDMVKEFGTDGFGDIPCCCYFVKDMKPICGDEFTITMIDDDYIYGHPSAWDISQDMIEPAGNNNVDELNFLDSYK